MFISKKITVLLMVFLLFFTQTAVLAADLNLPDVVITPDKYLFFSIKRLFEKGLIFVQLSNDSKVDYLRSLTLKRASELKFVVENKFFGEVERASQRFNYEIGTLSDYIAANKDLEKKKATTRDLFISYKSFLENLRDKYPANSSYWMLVQHSINSIDINLEKLK